jgi:choline dehydrogenase
LLRDGRSVKLAGVERFDAIVIGGGSAGCVVAARLAERDARVCLVEAGPDYGAHDGGAWPPEMLSARALPMTHLWETDDGERSSSRARIIGGCSAHNACIVIRGEPRDYDEWGPGWTYAELEPYLDRAEAGIGARPEIAHELAPWHRASLEAASLLGVPGGRFRANSHDGVRWNAAFAHVDPVRDRLEICADTLVDRIDPPRVVTSAGVLEADTIVLAAGAYGTPAILLRSGLGDELPVGENLVDHVGVPLRWSPSRRLLEETAAHEARHGPVFEAQTVLTPRDLHLVPWQNGEAGGYTVSMPVFFLKPFSRGRVTLTSEDPAAPVHIDHGFLSDERDVTPLAEGVALARALAATDAVARLVDGEAAPQTEEVERYVRANVRGYFHPVGTCALGAVCDRQGRVHGYESLVVCDASLLPTIPRANTNLTVLAVAERIAETL